MTVHTVATERPAQPPASLVRAMGPIVFIVFFGFLSIGLPIAALSIQVGQVMAFSPLIVGLVMGAQAVATIASRHRAGGLADRLGARASVLIGLPLAMSAGGCYLLATALPLPPVLALVVLFAGRILLGVGESFFTTATMVWGIGRGGASRTGRVMAWQGIAMFGALGVGAPTGLWLLQTFDFKVVALAAVAAPALALIAALLLPAIRAGGGDRLPFTRVVGLILRPGLVLCLGAAPFAVMAAFLALDFAERGWSGAGFALSAFVVGYIGLRLFLAHLPDQMGGAKVAGVSLAVQAAGQAVLWTAPTAAAAMGGALLTGIGFSLVFPSMGIEAARRLAPEQRGQALGNFMAFMDISLACSGPLAGLLAGWQGYPSVFLAGSLASLAALLLLPGLRRPG